MVNRWKTFRAILITLALFMASPLFAEGEEVVQKSDGRIDYFIACVVTAGVGMMVASCIAAISQSRAICKALEGISRQPSAAADIRGNLIIGLALIESLAIYVLVIALLLFFVNPFSALL